MIRFAAGCQSRRADLRMIFIVVPRLPPGDNGM